MAFFNLSFQEEKLLSKPQFKEAFSRNKNFHAVLKYAAKSSISENVFSFRTSGQEGKQFSIRSIDLSFGAVSPSPVWGPC